MVSAEPLHHHSHKFSFTIQKYPFIWHENMVKNQANSTAELPQDLGAYLDAIERDILVRALQECGYNRTATAQRLGITLRQVRYRIQQLGIACEGGDE